MNLEVVIKAAPARERAEVAKSRVERLPPVILELVDNDCGETTTMLLPAVQKVREAAR